MAGFILLLNRFAIALLSVVASMILNLTIYVSEALWGVKIANRLLGNDTEGLGSVAMHQGGIGLLLSILIVSVLPMAAMFFQGTLGSALTYSVFQGSGARPGPQRQPPGSWGGASAYSATKHGDRAHDTGLGFSNQGAGATVRTSGAPQAPIADQVKQSTNPNRFV